MKVLAIDDQDLFLGGFRLLVHELDVGMEVQTCPSVDQALRLDGAAGFELVLLDWCMPGMDGPAALKAVCDAMPFARIAVLSGQDDPKEVQKLIRVVIEHGCAGFIPKTSSTSLLTLALKTIASGGVYFPAWALALSSSAGPAASPAAPAATISDACPGLTARQCDVLAAALRGLPSKLIARQLAISETTVKTHLGAIYRELGVGNRTEATFEVLRRGVKLQ